MAHGNYTVCAAGLFYLDTREPLRILAAIVYPGIRRITGGYFSFNKLFSGYFGALDNQTRFPSYFINVCEASGFILLFPAVILPSARDWRRGIRLPAELVALLALSILITVWMLFGLPVALERAFLMDHIPPNRAKLALGIASWLATILYLGAKTENRSIAPAKIAVTKPFIARIYRWTPSAVIAFGCGLAAWNWNSGSQRPLDSIYIRYNNYLFNRFFPWRTAHYTRDAYINSVSHAQYSRQSDYARNKNFRK